jgi:hypothetical protein
MFRRFNELRLPLMLGNPTQPGHIGMPTVLRVQGFEFTIRLNDHLPAHVHAHKAGGRCKIVIQVDVAMAGSKRMKASDERRALRLARQNVALLRRKWEELHGPLG